MKRCFHKEADEIIKIIKKNEIRYLYHFTDIDNLPYIAKHGGLLSKEKLEQIGLLDKIKTGGNQLSKDLDIIYGNWDKVSLNWAPKMPMMWHIQQRQHLCILLIKVEVALLEDVIFTDKNAADSSCMRESGLNGIKLVDFSCVKDPIAHTDPERKKRKQAEILVPQKIGIDMIESIAFISEASLKEGERLWGYSLPKPKFKIDRSLFHEGFPYVETAILTSREVSREEVSSITFKHENKFNVDQKITLLAQIKANTGTNAKIIWVDKNGNKIIEKNNEFENEGSYFHWTSSYYLNHGSYIVKYYLDNIRWIEISFYVE